MVLLAAPYPITPSPLGLFRSVPEEEGIKGDLLQLILTNPGERVMLPQYGTPLRKYLFEQNTQALVNNIKQDILAAIKLWEPRIVVRNCEVSTSGGPNIIPNFFDPGVNNFQLGANNLNNNSDRNQQYNEFNDPNDPHVMKVKLSYSILSNLQNVSVLKLELPLGGDANG
jgi:phage baseplate assembly protein W